MQLINWGWFAIIHKTKPPIGHINLKDGLCILEDAAALQYGAYEEQLKTKVKLHLLIYNFLKL